MSRLSAILALLLLTGVVTAQDVPFSLTIIHTNDTHAGHLPSADNTGGAARMATVISQIRAEAEHSILLDAGDRFQGSLFHTQYKGQDQVQVMGRLGYDVMALGNHEFDNGDGVLAAFIDGVGFPVLAANLDASAEPLLADKIAPSTILDIDGQRIGVIGLITADTVYSSSPGPALVFSDDYAGIINAEAASLTEQGITKIIVVAHLGILDALRLIPRLQQVDVFIDGHSHTLFSNTARGAVGTYPQTFTDATGAPVYYGQTGANTQHVGRLDVTFDANGIVTAATGDTVFLSADITPDAAMEALVADLYEEVEAANSAPIGATTTEPLTGDRLVCRAEECALGSLIADGMRAGTGQQIAILNGGGIRANLDAGDITLGDVLTVQPFGNSIATFELTGANVVAALEQGLSGLNAFGGIVRRDGLPGSFPQVSGIRFTFDPTQPVGSRVTAIDLDTGDNTFTRLDLDATYSVVTNSFMRTGGDGYTVLAEQAINPYDFGPLDYELTMQHFAALGEVAPVATGRITMINAMLSPLP